MHRMTALALRVMQKGQPEVGVAAVAMLAAVYPGSVNASDNWPLCGRLTPHVQAIWATGAVPETAAMDALLNQSGIYLSKIADYPGAAAMSAARLERAEVRLPEADPKVTLALANHGVSLLRLGELPRALVLLQRAVSLDEAHRPASVDLADSYDLLGGVLQAMGRAENLVQAARRHQRAMALRQQLLGRGDAVARALHNLASVRAAQGRGAAAARLYTASLKILRATLPRGDSQLGYGMLNAGATWLQVGRADRAEPLLREALELRQGVYAGQPQHPETRDVADWLIGCLLRRAAVGENRGLREMEARQLCERYGFDFEGMKVSAMRYPYVPLVG